MLTHKDGDKLSQLNREIQSAVMDFLAEKYTDMIFSFDSIGGTYMASETLPNGLTIKLTFALRAVPLPEEED